jgi:hypothetical protein
VKKLLSRTLTAVTVANGSGTFFATLAVHGHDGTESFVWVAQGGTDNYRSLRGVGYGSTELITNPNGGINTYLGFLTG